MQKKHLPIKEAAEFIGVTTSYVRQLLACGSLNGYKVGERAWLVELNSLKEFKKRPKTQGRKRTSEN